ncbi:MAG: carbohydrate kinase family protein, partial [Acetobacteraceae bacterium]
MAGGRRGILTGGTWCLDRNKLVEFWPAEDGLAEILEEEARGGGSACNLAVDVKRLDPAFPVATVGLIGDDADGALLLAEADAHGIERSGLRVLPGARTQYTDAYAARGSGRRTHLFRRGTADLLSPAEFDF